MDINQIELLNSSAAMSGLSKKGGTGNALTRDEQRLKQSCQDFEAILLNKMLESMRKSLPEGGIFERNLPRDIWQSMYDQALTEKVARGNKSTGIGDALYNQLKNRLL